MGGKLRSRSAARLSVGDEALELLKVFALHSVYSARPRACWRASLFTFAVSAPLFNLMVLARIALLQHFDE